MIRIRISFQRKCRIRRIDEKSRVLLEGVELVGLLLLYVMSIPLNWLGYSNQIEVKKE